jgi:hypothetical protein
MLAPFGVDSHTQKRQKDNHYGANQHITQIHALPLSLFFVVSQMPKTKNSIAVPIPAITVTNGSISPRNTPPQKASQTRFFQQQLANIFPKVGYRSWRFLFFFAGRSAIFLYTTRPVRARR